MNRNLLSLLFFIISLSAFSQNYQVIYKTEVNIDNLKNIKDLIIKNNVESKLKAKQSHKFQLLVAGDKAVYSFYEQMLPEGIQLPKVERFYYKGNQVIAEREDVFVKYDLNHHQWTITDDSVTINGYVCYRAFTKRPHLIEALGDEEQEMEAWFCPDFPVKYGPEDFFGLPGLVLVARTKGATSSLVVEKIIPLKSAPQLKFPKIDKTFTPEEYKFFVNKEVNEFLEKLK
ncbi:GLPGLI family protein [Capnocytophaga canis]|uniref:GLPGLI family protein n=1 Tax=Capnocytophaga canis TaxID=1848903 RepID=UPI001AD1509F|nr:GLPGLI family protein [Capnocytophaga canis]GIM60110.1 GLPGLI family protein [Capnocytophaga canis]